MRAGIRRSRKSLARVLADRGLTQVACVYCGQAPATTWDHLHPIAGDGLDVHCNRVPACHGCNTAKDAEDYWVYLSGHHDPAGVRTRIEDWFDPRREGFTVIVDGYRFPYVVVIKPRSRVLIWATGESLRVPVWRNVVIERRS